MRVMRKDRVSATGRRIFKFIVGFFLSEEGEVIYVRLFGRCKE